jgi:uncharacterized protein (DUF302 family)
MNRPGNQLLRQMSSKHLFGAPFGVPHFFLVLFVWCSLSVPSFADDAVVARVANTDFRVAHDALIEAIEGEGLVVGSVLPFRDMLSRTVQPGAVIPYAEAEVVQFCSSLLAAELVSEAPAQLTLCPLSIALYTLAENSSMIHFAYRSPGKATAGRKHAEALLQRIVQRAAELARLRW